VPAHNVTASRVSRIAAVNEVRWTIRAWRRACTSSVEFVIAAEPPSMSRRPRAASRTQVLARA